jgi:hypothetical protein
MPNLDNPSIKARTGPRWWIVAAALSIIALIYAGFWFYLALNTRQGVVQWIEQQRLRGFTIRYDSLEATGFPFSIKLELTNPGFGAPTAINPWGWEGAKLQLAIKPWDMNNIQARTVGSQMLAFPVNGGMQAFTGEVQEALGYFRLAGGNPEKLRIVLSGVDLKPEKTGLGPIEISAADFALEQLENGTVNYQTPSWSLEGSAGAFSLPWLRKSPLGDNVRRLVIDGRLMGSLDTDPLIESLENWRDSGGTIEVRKLSVVHGPLKISTDGTLALDGLLQPIGALTARVEGFFETVNALQKLGIVKARDAITAKMVLGVLARKPKGGGPSTLNLALTVQERKVYAGPVELTEIPKIDWRALAR